MEYQSAPPSLLKDSLLLLSHEITPRHLDLRTSIIFSKIVSKATKLSLLILLSGATFFSASLLHAFPMEEEEGGVKAPGVSGVDSPKRNTTTYSGASQSAVVDPHNSSMTNLKMNRDSMGELVNIDLEETAPANSTMTPGGTGTRRMEFTPEEQEATMGNEGGGGRWLAPTTTMYDGIGNPISVGHPQGSEKGPYQTLPKEDEGSEQERDSYDYFGDYGNSFGFYDQEGQEGKDTSKEVSFRHRDSQATDRGSFAIQRGDLGDPSFSAWDPEQGDRLVTADRNKKAWDNFLKWVGQQYGPAALLIVTEADIEHAFREGVTPALQEEIITRLYAKNKEEANQRAVELTNERGVIQEKQAELAQEREDWEDEKALWKEQNQQIGLFDRLFSHQARIDAAVNGQNIRRAKEQLKELQKIAVEVKTEEIKNEIDLEITKLVPETPSEEELQNTELKSNYQDAFNLLLQCLENYLDSKNDLNNAKGASLKKYSYEEKSAYIQLMKQELTTAKKLLLKARENYLQKGGKSWHWVYIFSKPI